MTLFPRMQVFPFWPKSNMSTPRPASFALPLHFNEDVYTGGSHDSDDDLPLHHIAYHHHVREEDIELAIAWILPRSEIAKEYMAWLSQCTPPYRPQANRTWMVYMVDTRVYNANYGLHHHDNTAVEADTEFLREHGWPPRYPELFYLVEGVEADFFRNKWLDLPYGHHTWSRTNTCDLKAAP